MRRLGGQLWVYAAALALLAAAGILHRGSPVSDADLPPPAPSAALETAPPCASFVPDLATLSPAVGPVDLRVAATLIESGDRLYEERDLAWGNLYEAIMVWRAAAEEAAGLDPRPPLLYLALERILKAEEEFCERFRFHRSSAEVAFAAGDLERALYHAQVVLESIPEPFDARYQWAKAMQLKSRPAGEE